MTRDQILGRRTIKMEPLPVPEWGDGAVVYVREMSGAERDDFEAENAKAKESDTPITKNLRCRVLVRSLCNEDGSLIFNPEDAVTLGQEQGSRLILRLFEVAARLNGMDKGAEKN